MKECTDKEKTIYDFVLNYNKIKVDMIKGLIDYFSNGLQILGEQEGRDQISYVLGCRDGIFTAINYLANYSFDS